MKIGVKVGLTDQYVSGIVSQIDSYASGAITYWISDDCTTTKQMEVYKGKGLDGASFSAQTDLNVGDQVVINGTLQVEKIEVTGHSSASGSVKMNIYDGNSAASTETTGITGTQTFAIDESHQTAGTVYTLKITNANNAQIKNIKVTFKPTEITATLNSSGFATFCSEYPLDFTNAEDYTAWQITGIDSDNKITFKKITGSVKGGTGIFLKGEPGATVTLTSADSNNELRGNLLEGTLAPTYVEGGKYYGLSGNNFVKVNTGTVKAGKAIINADWIKESTGARQIFVFADEASGISEIEHGTPNTDETVYSLSGQRMETPKKGLYIVNGKKIVMK